MISHTLFGADSIQLAGQTIATGPENWPFWLLESLVANLLVALVVSIVTRTDQEELEHAYICLVDSLPTPRRQSLDNRSLEEVRGRLSGLVGERTARREIARACAVLDIDGDDLRPYSLRLLRDHLGFQLSAKLGTLASERILDEILPAGGGEAIDDITLVESQLAGAGDALSGLAAELNKLRLFHRQTLENLPIGVCSLDPNGEILMWNFAMAEMTGIPASATEGGHYADVPAPWGAMLASFYNSTEDLWPAHEVELVEGGARWLHLSKHRQEDRKPLHAGFQVILMEDITERMRLVQELAHAERLTSVGRLAAGVAHEIGNPVTGISCVAQDIIAETREESTRDYAQIVLELTERISTIVRTLMNFSRSGEGEQTLVPTRIKDSVDSAVQLLKLDKSAKNVTFKVDVDNHLLVSGESHQLTQVFVNLLANARDASPPGAQINIESGATGNDRVTVFVTDRGTGIPVELLDRVMDPFYTTKEPGAGTGLGLSLVYSIMRFHGGSVKITSPVENGAGTRVAITLKQAMS
jgi:PAS domain S-box-containing protein